MPNLRANQEELVRYRVLDSAVVLSVLAEYIKEDRDFTPTKNDASRRWHLSANGQDWELLTTGPKFFDTRANIGGGGAIDLTMHLFGLDFKAALSKLRSTSLCAGQKREVS